MDDHGKPSRARPDERCSFSLSSRWSTISLRHRVWLGQLIRPPREPVDYSPSIIPMKERKWIDIETGKSSLSDFEVSKKVICLLRHSQQVHREDDGAVQSGELKNIFRVNFHKFLIVLTIVGKHAWQEDEERKGDISTALTVLE